MIKVEVKQFCYWCGSDEYVVQEVDYPVLHDECGGAIEDGPTYKHIEIYCPKCDHLYYVDEVQKENIRRKREVEREYFGLCSYEDLLKIPKKYGVPRERVDEILNLESNLMLREGVCGVSLWKGEVPSTAESDRIKKALESPTYFLERMDAIKDELPKEFYDRARKRIVAMAEVE